MREDSTATAWAVHRPGGREVALMGLAVLGVSMSGPLTAMVAAPFLAIAFWRNAGGAVALVPVLLTRERAALAGLRLRDLRSSVLAGIFVAAHFAAWLPSLSMTTVAASTALVTTTPIWTALAARATGVRLPAMVWWGLVLAVVGAALIAGVDVSVSLRALAGDGLALLGAICAGGYVLAGAHARQRLPTSAYAVVAYSTCALAVAVAAVLLEVPGATIVALVLLGQAPPLLALPGMVAVVIGVALVVRASRPTTLVEAAT